MESFIAKVRRHTMLHRKRWFVAVVVALWVYDVAVRNPLSDPMPHPNTVYPALHELIHGNFESNPDLTVLEDCGVEIRSDRGLFISQPLFKQNGHHVSFAADPTPREGPYAHENPYVSVHFSDKSGGNGDHLVFLQETSFSGDLSGGYTRDVVHMRVDADHHLRGIEAYTSGAHAILLIGPYGPFEVHEWIKCGDL